MMSPTHLVLLPTFNTGPLLRDVVTEVLRHWQPVLVVVDGSTDGSDRALPELARQAAANTAPAAVPPLTILTLPTNRGKGAAVLAGAEWAAARGFSHALAMDADGQHPAAMIGNFMAISRAHPDALVLGRPIFPPNVPKERLHCRKISVALIRWAMLGRGIDDPLFGFRVYPIAPLLRALGPRRTGRRFDFDAEAAVRLCWDGVRPLNIPAPVRYLSRADGGISHFHYVRDNIILARMHTRLVFELPWHAAALRRHRARWRALPPPDLAPAALAPNAVT